MPNNAINTDAKKLRFLPPVMAGVIHKGSNSMINDTKATITDKTYLIFDLDGTIIDTDEANFLSYQEAVKKLKNRILCPL